MTSVIILNVASVRIVVPNKELSARIWAKTLCSLTNVYATSVLRIWKRSAVIGKVQRKYGEASCSFPQGLVYQSGTSGGSRCQKKSIPATIQMVVTMTYLCAIENSQFFCNSLMGSVSRVNKRRIFRKLFCIGRWFRLVSYSKCSIAANQKSSCWIDR